MALITCWDCRKQISDLAPFCMNCGRPMASQKELAGKRYLPVASVRKSYYDQKDDSNRFREKQYCSQAIINREAVLRECFWAGLLAGAVSLLINGIFGGD